MTRNFSRRKLTLILFGIVIFSLGAGIINLLSGNKLESQTGITAQISPTIADKPTPTLGIGQITNSNNPELPNRYTSLSKRISFDYYKDWKIKPESTLGNGNQIILQGPKQVLRIIEGTEPNYGFDDFKIENMTVIIVGKSYPARKFTSKSWGNSFIDLKIQRVPYELYVQYGDAASVGFQGYNQQYEDKVDFNADVQPINKILETLKY